METWNLLISKRIRPKRLRFNELIMVGAEGFEPPTLCSQSRCATRLRYAPTLPLYRESFPDCASELSMPRQGRQSKIHRILRDDIGPPSRSVQIVSLRLPANRIGNRCG